MQPPGERPPNHTAPQGAPEPPDTGRGAAGHFYRWAWVLYLVLAVAAVVWVGLREGAVPLSLFLDATRWWVDLGLGLAAGAVLLGVWEGARYTVPIARELERQLAELLSGIDPQEALALAILSGFSEELFFRGAVLGAFSSAGWFWSSVLFALLHTGPGRSLRFWSLFAFAAGLLFAALTVWTGNLLSAMTAHATINAVNLWRLATRADGREIPGGEEDGNPPRDGVE